MKRLFLLSFICAFGFSGIAVSSAQAGQLFLGGEKTVSKAPSVYIPNNTVKKVYSATPQTVKSQGATIYNQQKTTTKSYVTTNLNVDVPKSPQAAISRVGDTQKHMAGLEASRTKLAALEKKRISDIASKFKSVSLSSIAGAAGGLVGGVTSRVNNPTRDISDQVNNARGAVSNAGGSNARNASELRNIQLR